MKSVGGGGGEEGKKDIVYVSLAPKWRPSGAHTSLADPTWCPSALWQPNLLSKCVRGALELQREFQREGWRERERAWKREIHRERDSQRERFRERERDSERERERARVREEKDRDMF